MLLAAAPEYKFGSQPFRLAVLSRSGEEGSDRLRHVCGKVSDKLKLSSLKLFFLREIRTLDNFSRRVFINLDGIFMGFEVKS